MAGKIGSEPPSDLNIKAVCYDGIQIPAWYSSPGYFDPSQKRAPVAPSLQHHPGPVEAIDVLYVCHFCFKYSIQAADIGKHASRCRHKSKPPGTLQYKTTEYAIRKVAGASPDKLFCQCLCLFGKLFLDSKSIFYAVEGFEFYVLYEVKTKRPIGFFSKELNSWDDYNLACILVFPPFQSRGLGRLLIAFSYHISGVDGKLGSPEKPLSKYGRASYLSYWRIEVMSAIGRLAADHSAISITEISKLTAIRQEDVYETLNHLGALGKSGILVERLAASGSSKRIVINPQHCVKSLRTWNLGKDSQGSGVETQEGA